MILQKKLKTMSIGGGNTPIYQNDGRLKMAKSLRRQHPDVVKVVWKFSKWHHQVDYRPFKKNKLILADSVKIPKGVNNYGLTLKHFDEPLKLDT